MNSHCERRTLMKLKTIEDLLHNQVRDLYDAEKQLVKALPKLAKAASSPKLRKAFEDHLSQTKGQVARLEEVFRHLHHSPKGKTCEAMKGLIEEGEEMIEVQAEPEIRDAGLIAAAQKVEHYEIAGYGCLRTWAEQLSLGEVSRLLEETLKEEKQADELLTQIAEREVNVHATSN
jgi:ferritin-like metal-binding protein YciE